MNYEAIGPVEAHRVEVVARVELFVPLSAGEVADEQLITAANSRFIG